MEGVADVVGSEDVVVEVGGGAKAEGESSITLIWRKRQREVAYLLVMKAVMKADFLNLLMQP